MNEFTPASRGNNRRMSRRELRALQRKMMKSYQKVPLIKAEAEIVAEQEKKEADDLLHGADW